LHCSPTGTCPGARPGVDEEAYRAAWSEALAPVANDGLAAVTVLRDFHAENVMLIEGRAASPTSACSISRTRLPATPHTTRLRARDARRDVSPHIERQMIDRYMAATGHGAAFEAAYWALPHSATPASSASSSLVEARRKAGYRKFQPRMWGLLERDLAHPGLAPVKAWFDANVPPSARAAAWDPE
jgi:aminoglycoside/choline kinase family phosphotransferase